MPDTTTAPQPPRPAPWTAHDGEWVWFHKGERDRMNTRHDEAQSLLREALETYSAMTSLQFAVGADRAIREKIARYLGLNPLDYCLYVDDLPRPARNATRR